ncbi:MAG: metal ABC transporter substrate-binding protein [Nitrospirota bacterium]
MKTILMVLFGVLFAFGSARAAPLRVVTTTEDLAAIVREIGGPLVEVESLARGSQDPHFLEARPSLMLKASRADLFVQVGLGLEAGWASSVLVGARNPAIQHGASGYLDASRGIQPLDVPSGPVDRSQGDVHPFGNPHYWLDPENGKIIARTIAERLAALRPESAGRIEENRKGFERRLDEAIAGWKKRMAPYEGTPVVTYHNSWAYFARRFGLRVVGYVEPKSGIPPSPAHIQQLIQHMKREKVKVIIIDPYFARSTPDLIARETGARVLVLPPSVGGVEGIRTYFDLFDYLIDQLTMALSKGY